MRRALKYIAIAILLVGTFVVALTVGALLHLNTRLGRSWVRDRANAILAPIFEGRLTIEEIGGIGPHGLDGLRVTVHDPEGREVIRSEDMDVRLNVLSTAYRAIRTRDGVDITIDGVTIHDAYVSIERGPHGKRRIRSAFEIANKQPRKGQSKGPGKSVLVRINDVRIRHGYLHGRIEPQRIDGDVYDLRAALTITHHGVWIGVADARVETRAAPRGANFAGRLRGEITVPELSLAALADGLVGAIPVRADATIRDKRVDGSFRIGPGSGYELSWFLGSFAPPGTITVDGRVGGKLDRFAVIVHAQVADADGTPDGTAAAWALVEPSPPSLEASLEARRLNLAELDRRAPRSRVDAVADVRAARGKLAFELDLEPSSIRAMRLPPAHFDGRLVHQQLTLSGRVGPKSAPLSLQVSADLRNERGHATVKGERVELGRTAQLDGALGGTATIDADLEASWRGRPTISGRLNAAVEHLSVAGVRIADARIVGRAQERAPRLDVVARAEGVVRGGMQLDRVDARARGELDALATELSAQVGSQQLTATAELAVTDGFRVDNLEVHGLGAPLRAGLAVRGRGFYFYARGERVDLGALAGFVGVHEVEGTAEVNVELAGDARGITGELTAELDGGRIGRIADLDGRLDAHISGPTVSVDAWLTWGAFGWVDVSLDGRLGGSPRSLAGWKRTTGSMTLSASAELSELTTLERIGLLAEGTLPLANVKGRMLLNASAERERSESPPDLEVTLETQQIALDAGSSKIDRVAGKPVLTPPNWKLRGVDLRGEAALDGDTGQAELELRLTDTRGPLAWLDADAQLPYREIVEEGLRGRSVLERISTAPIAAWFSTDKRRYGDLPSVLRTEGMKGDIRISASFDGTLADPRASLIVRSFALESPTVPLPYPIDVVLLADWVERRADLHVKLFAPRRQLADAHFEADADLAALLTGNEPSPPWRASGRASVCDLPLESLGIVTGADIEGSVSGELSLEDVNRPTAELRSGVRFSGLRLNDVAYPTGRARLSMRNGALEGEAVLRQTDRGYARLRAQVPLRWQSALPELTEERGTITIDARRLRVAALQPVFRKAFDELDGRLDAKAQLELGVTPGLDGQLVIREGRFQLANFGETFFGTEARLRFTRDGNIVLDRFVTRSIGGRVEAKGDGHLTGLELDRARLSIRVPEDKKLPIVVNGEHHADASGRIEVQARKDGGRLRVDASIPELHAVLVEKRPHDVQELAPSKHMHIGVARRGYFAVVPLGPPKKAEIKSRTPILLSVTLGDKVRIERERKLMVELHGKAHLEITDRLRVAGKINVRKGHLEVRGRVFEIEHGTVTFTGRPPSDPLIVALASWKSPDGTRVFAEYVGPAKGGKTSLRSDPPLPEDQVLSLVVFGTKSQSPGRGRSVAGQAAGVGGAVVAPGLTEAIDDLTGLNVRLRGGSTSTNTPTTEVEIAITQEFSVQFIHLLGAPERGESPDRNYGSVNWRFRHNWTLETTIGDQGSTSLDTLWYHRY